MLLLLKGIEIKLIKKIIAIVFLLLFLSCEDKNSSSKLNDQPPVVLDFENIDNVNIDIQNLQDKLTKIIALDHLRSIGISYNNQQIFEHYKVGNINTKYPVYSITKSVLSTIVGQLIDQKLIDNEYSHIDSYLDISIYKNPEVKRKIRVNHLLAMRSGIEDDTNYIRSNNPIKYILDRDVIYAPGDSWNYSSAGTHVLSAIFTEISNRSAEEFAKEFLFDPLGIKDYYWEADINGISNGGWGLYLRLRDMLKFGNLYLNDGKSEDIQLISQSWIYKSTSKIITCRSGSGAWDYLPDNESGYGYLWWVNSIGSKDVFSALGYAGQYIILDNSRKLAIAITSDEASNSNYRQKISSIVFDELISIFPLTHASNN